MRSPYAQRGVALVAAIFLIVVIGAAVAVLATLAARNAGQTSQSLLSMRAQSAARAGLEMATQQLVESGGCAAVTSTLTPSALPGFSVDVGCSADDYGRPSQSFTLYRITAQAHYGNPGDADYAWTEINATLEL